MEKILCESCRKPLHVTTAKQDIVGEVWSEHSVWHCFTPSCDADTGIIRVTEKPIERRGYVTVGLLNRIKGVLRWRLA